MQKLKLHIELKKTRCLNCLRCYRFKNVNWSLFLILILNFPGGSDGKASVYNAGDPGSIPGLGRSPGEGNGNPLQDYCLENPVDRGAW